MEIESPVSTDKAQNRTANTSGIADMEEEHVHKRERIQGPEQEYEHEEEE